MAWKRHLGVGVNFFYLVFFYFQKVWSAVVNPISNYIAVLAEPCSGKIKEKSSILECVARQEGRGETVAKKQNSLFVAATLNNELVNSMTPAVRCCCCLHSDRWPLFLL